MKIVEYQKGVQEAYNQMPWMFAITKDNKILYRPNMEVCGLAFQDEEYDEIYRTYKYVESFLDTAEEIAYNIIYKECKKLQVDMFFVINRDWDRLEKHLGNGEYCHVQPSDKMKRYVEFWHRILHITPVFNLNKLQNIISENSDIFSDKAFCF